MKESIYLSLTSVLKNTRIMLLTKNKYIKHQMLLFVLTFIKSKHTTTNIKVFVNYYNFWMNKWVSDKKPFIKIFRILICMYRPQIERLPKLLLQKMFQFLKGHFNGIR